MLISSNWLNRYVDLGGQSPEDVRDALTMSTAEVEKITTFGAGLEDLVIGHVLTREKHPDADKLSVCTVDIGAGGEPLQIVCGASNVAADQRVVVIQPGQALPDGTKIKQGKIRGQVSMGMICSESELGLSEEHDGIIVLDKDYSAGVEFSRVVSFLDHVLEIDNKSINHRPDLWGHYGIARELAAILNLELQEYGRPVEFPASGEALDVSIEDLAACPRYTGLCIGGVKATRSPDWLRYLLHAVGQRSINLLVDLTNFVMLDLGQPMHAFDRRRLRSDVVVRRAKAGETMTTLDEMSRDLTEEDLLITSGGEPVALAGIMGGQGSMVDDETTELFLESATFHAATVRRTSVRLGLRTDSSARFEKTLDPANAELGIHRFVGMLQDLCPGAAPSGPLADPAQWRYEPVIIRLRKARLDLKLGIQVPDQQVRSILESLEFEVRDADDGFDVTVPSMRASKDIGIEDDLIEEIGRMFRYDNIPEVPLSSIVAVPHRDEELNLARDLSRAAALELSANEVYNYSFQPDALLEAVGARELEYTIVGNPVAPEICRMRRHVLPSLLSCLGANLRNYQSVRLFEVGKGYHPESRDQDGLAHEVSELAIAFAQRGGSDYSVLRTGLVSLLKRQGFAVELDELMGHTDLPWIHPGMTVALTSGAEVVGYVGTLHPQIARNLDLPRGVAIANLDLRQLLRVGRKEHKFVEVSRFPTQPVDVALMVPTGVQVKTCANFLREVGRKLVMNVQLFEAYRGAELPEGVKSLNFTVTLGATDRTLDSKDEEKYLSKVRERCGEVQAELRG
ncbi:MAG: phenylalanine--tRNA ligase subunit beta [Planctomycetota bacterium]|nr:phenylalanine--tRNA ligase subunit beta [Planctomycetota bacterium]